MHRASVSLLHAGSVVRFVGAKSRSVVSSARNNSTKITVKAVSSESDGPRIAGIIVGNLSKCSPEALRALVQRQIDKLSPGLADYEVQHETDNGSFQRGWPADLDKFISRDGEIVVRSPSFNTNFAERLTSLEVNVRHLVEKDQESSSRISSLENDNSILKHISFNQMKVLRRIFLDSFRKDFRLNGPAPRPLKSWNDWVSGLDSTVSVKGLTRDDLELTLFGKKMGDGVAQSIGDTAAHEADASQIAVALDFFMTERGESKRWDNLFTALYGISVKDALDSLN